MADLTLASPPRISAATFARILADAGSPALPESATCYEAVRGHGLDPAVALAFFQHESSYGLRGIAARSRNWGNLRRGKRASRIIDGFAHYACWLDGLEDWCDLMQRRYIGQGLPSVRAALPVYAPSSDGNKPQRYADAVCALVARWQAAETAADDRRMVVREAARLRTGPNRQSDIIRTLPAGLVVSVDHIIADGEAVEGSQRWAALTTGGYVWAGLLKEVTP